MGKRIIVRIGEKQIGVVIETGVLYSGKPNPPLEEKVIRKALDLPLMKQLVFYTTSGERLNITDFEIEDYYDEFDLWFEIRIYMPGQDRDVLIHSNYLAQMQNPHFIENKYLLPDETLENALAREAKNYIY